MTLLQCRCGADGVVDTLCEDCVAQACRMHPRRPVELGPAWVWRDIPGQQTLEESEDTP